MASQNKASCVLVVINNPTLSKQFLEPTEQRNVGYS